MARLGSQAGAGTRTGVSSLSAPMLTSGRTGSLLCSSGDTLRHFLAPTAPSHFGGSREDGEGPQRPVISGGLPGAQPGWLGRGLHRGMAGAPWWVCKLRLCVEAGGPLLAPCLASALSATERALPPSWKGQALCPRVSAPVEEEEGCGPGLGLLSG